MSTQDLRSIDDAPYDVANPIREFWPEAEWDNAASVAFLESGWDAFALNDTTTLTRPCGAFLRTIDGVDVSAERSVGYFQINACNFPSWEWQRLYNGRHNAGTAHDIWTRQGWGAWFFSATRLGLI